MNYLSVCAIAKNETPYLKEWVDFHKVVGIEHFYIYDNSSDIPIKETLTEYADFCTVIDFPGNSMQMPAYTHCIQNFGRFNKWIAFIDCDEYLVPREKNSVPEVLSEYKKFAGFNVSWRIFGSNGHLTRPDGLIIENYILASPKDHYENTHTKAIIQPEFTISAGSNPHHFRFKPGYYSISEDFKVVPNAWTPHCSDKLQLNHYFTKSLEEFKIKIARGRADAHQLTGRKLEDFYAFDNLCTEKDECALRFVDQVKKSL